MEAILGLSIEKDRVRVAPCLPKGWSGYEAELAGPDGSLVIRVHDPDKLGRGTLQLVVDGVPEDGNAVVWPAGGQRILVEASLSGSH